MRVLRRQFGFRVCLLGLILYLALCATGGIYLADGALHPARRQVTEQEVVAMRNATEKLDAAMEDVTIKTPDEATLSGWMLRPHHGNGDAVILLHGLGDNRIGMTGYAQLLLAHGFTVLLPDARAHGASGGEIATYGLLERNDIRKWVDFLSAHSDPHCVFGFAESMGAAQLLQSLSGAHFCAVAVESSFATFREIAYDRMGQPFHLGPWLGRTLLRPVIEVAFLRARWRYRLNMEEISPENSVAATSVPVLLIHGEVDSNIPVRHSRRIHARNRKTILWEVPGADHCGAISVAPEEFEQKLLGWFRENAQKQRLASDTFVGVSP